MSVTASGNRILQPLLAGSGVRNGPSVVLLRPGHPPQRPAFGQLFEAGHDPRCEDLAGPAYLDGDTRGAGVPVQGGQARLAVCEGEHLERRCDRVVVVGAVGAVTERHDGAGADEHRERPRGSVLDAPSAVP